VTRPFLAPPATAAAERSGPPSFSIAIAAYEAAATIGEALESAFAQTLPALEVVVCDDGSTDDLETAVAPFHDRITLLRRPHRGAGAAKDTAVRATRGEFVVLLDADDVFLPERLEALAELAVTRPDLDILGTDAWLDVDGEAVRRTYDETWTFEVDDQRAEILRRNFIVAHVAVRRERLLAAGGFDPSMASVDDWELWIRLILGGARAGIVDEPLARYRVRETSLSAQPLLHERGCVRALELALARTDLSAREREVAGQTLAAHRRALARAELDAALAGAGDARRHALAVARDGGEARAMRLKAAAAAAAPWLARRVLAGRAAREWTGTANVRVHRSGPPAEARGDGPDETAEPVAGVPGEPLGVVRRDDAGEHSEADEDDDAGERPEDQAAEPVDR
jgi:hypothetical protein